MNFVNFHTHFVQIRRWAGWGWLSLKPGWQKFVPSAWLANCFVQDVCGYGCSHFDFCTTSPSLALFDRERARLVCGSSRRGVAQVVAPLPGSSDDLVLLVAV